MSDDKRLGPLRAGHLRGPVTQVDLEPEGSLTGAPRPQFTPQHQQTKEDEMTTIRGLYEEVSAFRDETRRTEAKVTALEAAQAVRAAAEEQRVKAAQAIHGTPERAALVAKHAAALDAELAANPGDFLAASKKVNRAPEFAPLFGTLTSQGPSL